MIGKLTGIVVSANHNPIVLDVHDVGYRVLVLQKMVSRMKPGLSQSLFIYTHVREDAIELMGFDTEDELDLFELLLTVSGVGPKTALSVINRGAAAVKNAVMKSDVAFFTSVPRLGKKNAQKIIIELKSKIGSTRDLDLGNETDETRELFEVLLSMGFVRSEIAASIKKLPAETASMEEKIRAALRLLGRSVANKNI